MNLGEQLEELRRNLLRDISDLAPGGVDDRLFTDKALLTYIKDAEHKFARRTFCILDGSTPKVTQIKLVTAQTLYQMHPSVFALMSARYTGKTTDLVRAGRSVVGLHVPAEFLTFDPSSNVTLPNGEPQVVYTDESMMFGRNNGMTLSVFPAPSSVENNTIINIRVFRKPTCGYTIDDLDRESELPEDYQLDVLTWAAVRAFNNFDADKGSAAKIKQMNDLWNLAIRDAIKDSKRRLFSPVKMHYGTDGSVWTR